MNQTKMYDTNQGMPQFQYCMINKQVCNNIDTAHIVRLSSVKTERGLTESLLDVGESVGEKDELLPKVISLELAESIAAWPNAAPNARIVIQRKKRVPAHSADEINVRTRNHVEEYARKNRRGFDLENTTSSSWRMCIEPTTYRYLPNNGRYRSTKVEHKVDRDSKIARTIRSMEKLTPEQRHLQKEIQCELRKEFEMQQQLERQTERQKAILWENEIKSESRSQLKHGGQEASDSNFKSTPLMGREAKDPLFHKRNRTPVELPPFNVPLIGRSLNDKYLEKFKLRINNIEEELKRDQMLLKKKQQERAEELVVSNSQVFRSRTEPSKTAHYMNFTGMALFTEPVTENCLSVRPITNHKKQRNRTDGDRKGDHQSPRTPNNIQVLDEKGLGSSPRVYIKYTTSKGEMIRIPKFNRGVNGMGPARPGAGQSSADPNVLLRKSHDRSDLSKSQNKTGADALHAREYLVSSNSSPPTSGSVGTSLKIATSKSKNKNKNNSYTDIEAPMIIAEGMFTHRKNGVSAENVQVTVTKRKRKKLEALPQGFIPVVAGKNCEVPQQI